MRIKVQGFELLRLILDSVFGMLIYKHMALVEKIGTYTGHRDCVYTLEKADTPTAFFSASGDGMVVRWDLLQHDQGELICQVENSVYAMASDEAKNHLIIGHNFKGIHVIDLSSKKELRNIQFTEHAIYDLQIVKDRVLAASGDGKIYVFRLEDFQLENVWNHSDKNARCMAVHPSKDLVAVGYSDHSIRIFHIDTGGVVAEWKGHANSVFSLVFSPDGSELLSGSRDAHLKIWSTKDYSLKEDIVAHMFAIHHIVFSSDRKWYASASMDKSIKLWDAATHKLLKVIDKSRHAGHGTSVNKLLWTQHHDQLISASDDRSISIWGLRMA
jgi:WD40 repeat protein